MTRTRLREIRKRRGIPAADLAKKVGVARQTIYAIEDGSFIPNTTIALRLGRALDASVDQLFELEDGTPPPASVEARLVDDTADIRPGQPVTLCPVGKRLIAVPPSFSATWMPDSDAIVTARHSTASIRAQLPAGDGGKGKHLLIGGCDPAIPYLAGQLDERDVRITFAHASSRQALEWLRDGKIHVAGSHIADQETGEFNIPLIRSLFPRGGFRVVTFANWEQGLVVPSGNPKHIRSAADLAGRDVRIVNRPPGAGSRALLDQMLQQADLNGAQIRGYDTIVAGHVGAALAVASGQADCCVATRSVARALGLAFVPLTFERFDLVTLERYEHETSLRILFDSLNQTKLRRRLEFLAGYDTAKTGTIVA
jgi:putative molybdopterin biosynthesis protein